MGEKSDSTGASQPILLIGYKRPALTAQVIQSLSTVEPKRLYFCVDGPKDSSESAACAEVRSLISSITWDCELITRFRDRNLGCREGVVDAVGWFFDHEEMGVVLEDDVVPHPSFLEFASQMLERYRYDSRIMKVSGFNPVGRQRHATSDYFFAHLSFSWGWASWRRAWAHYSPKTTYLKQIKEIGGLRFPAIDRARHKALIAVDNGLDTWDYQWDLSIASQNGLHIVPSFNLVENIGFGSEATHTLSTCTPAAFLRSEQLDCESLRHPAIVMADIRLHRAIRAWQRRAAWFRWICHRLPSMHPKRLGALMRALSLMPKR